MALAPQLKAPCRMLALSRLEKSGPAAPQRPVPDPPEGHPPSALAWPAQSGPPLHRPQQLAPAVEKDPAGVGADSSAGFSLQLLWTDSVLRSVARLRAANAPRSIRQPLCCSRTLNTGNVALGSCTTSPLCEGVGSWVSSNVSFKDVCASCPSSGAMLSSVVLPWPLTLGANVTNGLKKIARHLNHRLEPLSATDWLKPALHQPVNTALCGCERECGAVFQCASGHVTGSNRNYTHSVPKLPCPPWPYSMYVCSWPRKSANQQDPQPFDAEVVPRTCDGRCCHAVGTCLFGLSSSSSGSLSSSSVGHNKSSSSAPPSSARLHSPFAGVGERASLLTPWAGGPEDPM